MSAHPVQWQSPQPLWARFGASAAAAVGADDQARPAILRFASDEFMDQIIGTLARDPAQIDRLLARPETWRAPMQDGPDLVERVPVPRATQDALRLGAAKRPKTRGVPAVLSTQPVQEQRRTRDFPLKLYQPAHQRHYLVGASLVCALPGLPERAVVPGGAEQASFVLRRMLQPTETGTDPADLREFAYIKDASGARWQRVGNEQAELAPGEELLPVFPLAHSDDAQHARTMWTGLVPVGRREEYLSGRIDRTAAATFASGQRQSVLPPAAPAREPGKEARMMQFKLDVAEPWKNLIRSSWKTVASVKAPKPGGLDGDGESVLDKRTRVFNFNVQQQMASWLILLDFADYLENYLGDVWNVIKADGAGALSLPPDRLALHTWLAGATMSTGLKNGLRNPSSNTVLKNPADSLAAALKEIVGKRDGLERAESLYDETNRTSPDWPGFHYLLGGIERNGTFGAPVFAPCDPFAGSTAADAPDPEAVETDEGPALDPTLQDIEDAAAKVDILTAKIVRALVPSAEADAPPPPFALQVAKALRKTAGDPGWFVVRFVYTRRDCGPLHPPTLSAPTQRFQLANFFDPDAPARPIRISLPLDTSPAGLRKFNKNTAFVISDMLCGQIQRAKGLGFIDLVLAVLPWPFHKDLPTGSSGPCKSFDVNIGMICSLSIPIITICALILLTIIVMLLDLIFRWLPWFVICFPVLKLRGKQE
jgi:hypothetical protein